MKKVLVFNILFVASFHLSAQCNFDQLIKEGRSAAKREDFELALNKFNSARRCDPVKGGAVDKEVAVVFKAINNKKIQAVKEKRRAEAQKKIAEEEKRVADIERNTTKAYAFAIKKLGELSEKKARNAFANEIALRSATEKDPTKIVRLLEFALKVDPNNERVVGRLIEVCNDPSSVYWQSLMGHTGAVNHIAFTSDGSQLATASDDNTIGLWESATGRCLFLLPGHDAPVKGVAFSPDGLYLASASEDETVKLWRISDQHLVHTLNGHTATVASVVFSPDGQRLVSASADGTVIVWDAQSGMEIKRLENPLFELEEISSYGSNPYHVTDGFRYAQFEKDTSQLLTLSNYRGVQEGSQAAEDQDTNGAIAVSASGALFATKGSIMSRDKVIRVLSIYDGNGHLQDTTPILTIINDVVLTLRSGSIVNACFSNDDHWAALLLKDNTVEIWDLIRKVKSYTLPGQTDPTSSLCFNPDATMLCTGALDHVVRLWRLHTRPSPAWFKNKNLAIELPIYPSFSCDRKTMIVPDLNDLEIWDVLSKKWIKTVGAQRQIALASLSCDGTQALCETSGGMVFLWQTDKRISKQLGVDYDVKPPFLAPVFAPGKHTIVGCKGKNAIVFDIMTDKIIDSLKHPELVNYACFSPDGKFVATTSDDRTAVLWSGVTFKPLFHLKGHHAAVSTASFAPDGKWLATTSTDKTLKVWDTATGMLKQTLSGFKTGADKAIFSPDGGKIVATSADNSITIWNWQSNDKPMHIQTPFPNIEQAAILPDQNKLAVVFSTGFDVWCIQPDSLLEEMRRSFKIAPLTPEMMAEYDLEDYFQYAGITDSTGMPMPILQNDTEEALFHYAVYYADKSELEADTETKDEYRKKALLLLNTLEKHPWLHPEDFYQKYKRTLLKQ